MPNPSTATKHSVTYVNVLTSATSLVTADANVTSIRLRNTDSTNPIFYAQNTSVSSTGSNKGVELAAGQSVSLPYCSWLYAIATGGTVSVMVEKLING